MIECDAGLYFLIIAAIAGWLTGYLKERSK